MKFNWIRSLCLLSGLSLVGILSGYSNAQAQQNLRPLEMYWNGSVEDNYTLTDGSIANNLLSNGYVFVRDEGCILQSPPRGVETRALDLYYSSSRGDGFTASTSQGREDARGAGYRYLGRQGYIYSTRQPGTIPLYLYWKGSRGDNYSLSSSQGRADARGAGYVQVRIQGYVYPGSDC